MGIAFAPQPISSTEQKIIADLRLHWNALMTRVYAVAMFKPVMTLTEL